MKKKDQLAWVIALALSAGSLPVVQAQFRVVDAFTADSERAAGGYGSTGRK